MERTGLTGWTFGDLDRVVETTGTSHATRAYPALVDEGDTVAVRLMAGPAQQAEAMWTGTRESTSAASAAVAQNSRM